MKTSRQSRYGLFEDQIGMINPPPFRKWKSPPLPKPPRMRKTEGADLDRLLSNYARFHFSSEAPAFRPALERLSQLMPPATLAALVDLTYRWNARPEEPVQADYAAKRLETARQGLEFLADEADAHAGSVITLGQGWLLAAQYMWLRRPWRAHFGKKHMQPQNELAKTANYGNFMRDVLEELQKLDPDMRADYLWLAHMMSEIEPLSAAIMATDLSKRISEFGFGSIDSYFRTGFEWLRQRRKADTLTGSLSQEMRQAVWHFLQKNSGSEGGLAELTEHLNAVERLGRHYEGIDHRFGVESHLTFLLNPTERREVLERLAVALKPFARYEKKDGLGEFHVQKVYIHWSLAHIARSAPEQPAELARFTDALLNNYLPAVARALERSNWEPEGIAADLLDEKNADFIAKHLFNAPFWEQISSVVSEAPVASPGGWVPSSADAAHSFLEAIKGEYFEAEKALLAKHAEDIAVAAGLEKRLAVLDLGLGSGEKLAVFLRSAMLQLPVRPEALAICGVESNSIIALEGLEGLTRGLGIESEPARSRYTDRAVEESGRTVLAGSERPVRLDLLMDYFESLANNPLFQRFARENQDYLLTFLGTTFGNFEPSKAGKLLRTLAGNWALVGVNLYSGNDESLIAAYDTPGNLSMAHHSLMGQGVRHEDLGKFEHVVEVRKRNEHLDGADLGVVASLLTYVAVRPGNEVKTALRQFKGGDIVNVGLSKKYTDDQMRKVLDHSGFKVEHAWFDGPTGLYLARKVV